MKSKLANVIFGIHAVRKALHAESQTVQSLLLIRDNKNTKKKPNGAVQEIMQLAKTKNVRTRFVARSILDKQAGNAAHQGVMLEMLDAGNSHNANNENTLANILIMTFDDWRNAIDMQAAPLILLLDCITDAGNLGACMRTAAAADCNGIVMPRDRSAALTPAAIKVASGAASSLPLLRVTNLVRSMQTLQEQGFWLIGLDQQADCSLYTVQQNEPSCPIGIVMGAEDKGLRPLVRKHCDQIAAIPMPGNMESLNVSVATGIALFSVIRNRG
ncbi:MAG: 23S rRNA (guanosine(2251)-2'-O)-methyltransferase RlmB [Mariprofundales bacterium]